LNIIDISPDYIAGFVDGEGCFALKFRRDVRYDRKNKPTYYYWAAEFAILLRDDDHELLKKIKTRLGCGNISKSRLGTVRYSVTSLKDLRDKIIPFFTRHRLYGKKRFDFELWEKAIEILAKNQQGKDFKKIIWDEQDLKSLKEIRERMKQYKSKGNEWKWVKNIP